MLEEDLVQKKKYIYINLRNEEIRVIYLGVKSDGITLFKFRDDNGITYSLFQYEIAERIKNI